MLEREASNVREYRVELPRFNVLENIRADNDVRRCRHTGYVRDARVVFTDESRPSRFEHGGLEKTLTASVIQD